MSSHQQCFGSLRHFLLSIHFLPSFDQLALYTVLLCILISRLMTTAINISHVQRKVNKWQVSFSMERLGTTPQTRMCQKGSGNKTVGSLSFYRGFIQLVTYFSYCVCMVVVGVLVHGRGQWTILWNCFCPSTFSQTLGIKLRWSDLLPGQQVPFTFWAPLPRF